jgi:excisionase family DNA binding protein
MTTLLQSEWLTVEEAAAYLKVKPRSLLLWVRDGKVPAYALSGTVRRVWRFRKEDLDSCLLSRAVVDSGISSSVRSPERRIT